MVKQEKKRIVPEKLQQGNIIRVIAPS